MTNPSLKIEVKDLTEKALNFREELLKLEDGKKPFIFKGFKTEEDRVKDAIRNNSFLFNEPLTDRTNTKNFEKNEILDYNTNPNSERTLKNQLDYIIDKKIIVQPEMRFKARTDLERVYDAIRARISRENERNILKRQLKNIGLYSFNKPNDIIRKANLIKNNKYEDLDDSNNNFNDNFNKRGYKIIKTNIIHDDERTEEKIKKKIYGSGKLYYVPKYYEFKPWKRKLDLNQEAQNMLSEFHVKTHFKATQEIAENKIVTKKKDNKKNNNIIFNANKFKKKDPFKFEQSYLNDKENEPYYINYSKNENPFNLKRNVTFDKSTLNALSMIAFKNNDDNYSFNEKNNNEIKSKNIINEKNEDNENSDKKNLVDEQNVLIGNEIYYKDSQLDIIANKVLNSCNIYKQKSKRNNTKLVKRSGKLMITHGMSVKQFESKYHFKDSV